MGYYSDFRIMTTLEGREALEDYVKKHTKEGEINFFKYLDEDKVDKKNNLSLFGNDNVKWYRYSDFAEVDNFINGMEFLKEKGIPWCFIRIGENMDDIEYKEFREKGNLPSAFYLERKAATYGGCRWEERE